MSAKFISSFCKINITYAWTNGWTDKQTDKSHKRDGPNGPTGLDGRTDAPKSWIKRTKGQTRGHMERTHGQMNWIKRPDGRTD